MSAAAGVACAPEPQGHVGGGCINECFRWHSADGWWFVKLAPVGREAMLAAEAEGLRELAGAHAVRVPRVHALGRAHGHAFLVLEWLEQAKTTDRSQALLGERLAAQHRMTASEFGWRRDNTIGLTPQVNRAEQEWLAFFREHRLRFQLTLAARNGFGSLLADRGERLLEAMPKLLAGHRPQASLLHGDLWGGNWFTEARGEPAIFDPAVYYGDREADLAMTHLFGGFGTRFYAAYEASWPLDAGHRERRDLYNLYHLLNHANLFGESYAQQAARTIDRLVGAAQRA